MNISDKHVTRILGVILSLALLSSLFFWPTFTLPFSSPALLGFLFFVELSLPFFFFLTAKREQPFAVFRQPVIFAFTILASVLVLTSILGIDPLNSLLGTARRPVSVLVVIHGLLFILALRELFERDPNWKSHMTTLIIAMSTIISIHALGEQTLWPSFVSNEGRAASLLGNPVFLASFLMIPCFLSFARAVASTKKTRIVYLTLGLLMLLGIFQSGTRGAFIGLMAGGFLWACLWFARNTETLKRRLGIGLGVGTLFVVVVLVGWALSPSSVFDRLQNAADESVQSRLLYWGMAIEGWKEHPLLGVGPGNFYVVADQLFTMEDYTITNTWPDKPHNTFLEYLSTSGLVGTIAWLLVLAAIVREAWKRRQEPTVMVLFAGLTAYIVQGMFFFDGISDYILFAFLAAWSIPLPTATITHGDHRPIPASAVGVLLLIVGLSTYILPLRTEVAMAGRGEIPKTSIVVDDLLVSRTASTLAQQATTNQLELVEIAIVSYDLSLDRHPQRQAAWNDQALLYYLKALLLSRPVEPMGLAAVQRAIELAPGRREAPYILELMQEHNTSFTSTP
jgi:O-antigen ligase